MEQNAFAQRLLLPQPMKKSSFLALVGALCALLVAAPWAHACSCLAPPAPKIALQQSAAVFAGRVASVQVEGNNRRFTFDVSQKWKGVKGAQITVSTPAESAMCGINFDSDRDYLVYAFTNDKSGTLRVNLCTRTARLADAATDVAALGAPQSDEAAAQPPVVNGVVQLNPPSQFGGREPLVLLNQTLAEDKDSTRFRLTWNIGWSLPTSSKPAGETGHATAIYDRKTATLKLYARTVPNADKSKLKVHSLLYSGVTDAMLSQLEEKYRDSKIVFTSLSFLDRLPELGATITDVGSATRVAR